MEDLVSDITSNVSWSPPEIESRLRIKCEQLNLEDSNQTLKA